MLRRSFVAGLGALWLPSLARAEAPLADNPFGLGVASGHPRSDSVVLWTRLLAAEPTQPLTGTYAVDWVIAEDERLTRVVGHGQAAAEARWGHSVHVEVDGLKPGRPYWYRFAVNGKGSAIGRTLTAPGPDERVPLLKFAFASCQQYEQGYYAALRHMAGEELNAVLFLGDYIYEISWGRNHVRRHGTGRPTLLFEFRNRYALYKSDPDLQAAHAAHPWIVTWDDHEVANDYADDLSPNDLDPGQFLKIRAAAYQAYWEHMPLPASMQPKGPSLRLYDRYRFGDLAELFVIDDRQYRSHNACHAELTRDRMLVDCAERLDPSRTMLGAEQETWFADALKRASGRWNLLAQQTLMAEAGRLNKDGKRAFWGDGWDGYPAARQKLLDVVAASPVKDTVVMSGDVHSFWATDLKQDFAMPKSRTVATEFVGGSVTSQGFSNKRLQPLLHDNPHLRYGLGDAYGYGHLALEAKAATVSFRTVDDVRNPKSGIATPARFVVEAGSPGVNRA
ncbi:alkaline phosphatase D family protein [Reyranella sp.]|uniref:alkaline phosphatase D family protein n=1 Tax=Reyranella sp. TaxID=1929291 RepID=UPI002F9583BD